MLDEPVSALDVSVQARVINLIQDLQAELDLTLLFIANDLAVVRHIADRVAVMYLGTIMEIGPTRRVFEDPATPYTLSLLSAIPGSSSPAPDDLERITLRGTPPNPRFPPDGSPFSTRCPAKIRSAGYEDLPEDAREAIEAFRTVLRERSRSGSVGASLKRRLGIDDGERSIDAIADDLFADVALPARADDTVQEATRIARSSDTEAVELLAEGFGSVCDR